MQEVDERLKSHEPDFDETDATFNALEKQVDSLRLELYDKFRPRLQHKDPVDLNNVEERRYLAATRTVPTGPGEAAVGAARLAMAAVAAQSDRGASKGRGDA